MSDSIVGIPDLLALIKQYLAADSPLKRADCHKRAHELIAMIEGKVNHED